MIIKMEKLFCFIMRLKLYPDYGPIRHVAGEWANAHLSDLWLTRLRLTLFNVNS